MEHVQLIIPHVAANNTLLVRNIPFIKRNINPSSICIIARQETLDALAPMLGHDDIIRFVSEDSVIPGLSFGDVQMSASRTGIPEKRTGWYLQQFIKLGWALRGDCPEWYACWDSDTFPLQPYSFFTNEGKPVFAIKKEYNPAYFQTMRLLWGLEKKVPYSFISEAMVFKKSIVRSLIREVADSMTSFCEQILSAASESDAPVCGFSEFETYGTYVLEHDASLYDIRMVDALRNGAGRYGMSPSDADLWRASLKYETISFEKWSRQIPVYIILQKSISSALYYAATVKDSFCASKAGRCVLK